MRLLTAAALAALTITGAACKPAEEAVDPALAPAVVASPDVHSFRIGTLQAYALRDGQMTIPNDNQAFGVGLTPQVVSAALAAAGQPGGQIPLGLQPLLIRDGDRIVLIDTGAAGEMGTQGKLMAALKATGVEPGQVTDILISHYHGDHIGGLVTRSGALAFPNATIHISAADWDVMEPYPEGEALVAAIRPRVRAFSPGEVLTPSITAVTLAGHTEGHTGYEVVSGEQRLLYIGDAMHSSVLSIGHPEWTLGWDSDGPAGIATRETLLERAERDDLMLYGVHFPWPGLGHVKKQGKGYVWAPENPASR
jgi:glyoxylase-like metal-dependent hydrolase (beta-lactamase superfamily II)